MTELQILEALKTTIPLLDSTGVNYWLARGVLRNLYIRNKIGGSNSDLDFHIWKKDSEVVKAKLLPAFSAIYDDLEIQEKDYKLAFFTPVKVKFHDFFVEFMFLNPDDDFVYHERMDGARYANAECYSSERHVYLQYNEQLIRIPALVEEYLFGTYGPRWRENRMDDKVFKSTPDYLRESKI